MAEQKYKSPEELGEAVGRKIEELFGGLFADESPQEDKPPEPAKPEPIIPSVTPVSVPKSVPTPISAAAPAPAQRPVRATAPAPSVPRPAPLKPQPARPLPKPAESAPPVAAAQHKGPSPFEEAIEQIEVIVLNLEWEVSPESIRELFQKLKELERVFTSEGPARNILAMNMRILPRFDRPDSVPHPALLKLLQDSVAALKSLHAAPMRPPNQSLISSITNSYKQIMSAVASVPEPAAKKTDAPERTAPEFGTVVNKVGGAVRSLEEVSQRLARILGVLRQGGDMSSEEITRRLGTLEHLLSERVGQLSSLQKELSHVPKPVAGTEAGSASDQSAVMMFLWEGIPLAVPSSSLAGLYPLAKTQAAQFKDKQDITLGTLFLKRLPLKKATKTAGALPTWLVHLSRGEKHFFVLADRLIGYRRSPMTVDVENQARLKIGQSIYTIISKSMLR
ncbi:MAG: hypothetical protein HY912_20875 [Desulfomonile tiedjei]|uniref:Uncharacterized protein n=1 Tax=Desulfomonile tiedjei TaxID=2358 RepID=A0A9D6Z5C7_9BACT|nr:hypothetical protein [Desulfomonile tiedjei]